MEIQYPYPECSFLFPFFDWMVVVDHTMVLPLICPGPVILLRITFLDVPLVSSTWCNWSCMKSKSWNGVFVRILQRKTIYMAETGLSWQITDSIQIFVLKVSKVLGAPFIREFVYTDPWPQQFWVLVILALFSKFRMQPSSHCLWYNNLNSCIAWGTVQSNNGKIHILLADAGTNTIQLWTGSAKA